MKHFKDIVAMTTTIVFLVLLVRFFNKPDFITFLPSIIITCYLVYNCSNWLEK